MIRKFFVLAAWINIGFIVCATLVPLAMRPKFGDIGANYERFAAYALASAMMVLAYPRYSIRIGLAIALIAVVLEICQLAIPDRDARVVDTIVKILGTVVGTSFAFFFDRWMVKRAVWAAKIIAG